MVTYKAELTEDFIYKVHSLLPYEWKQKTEQMIPNAFNNKFELNKWYKYSIGDILAYYKGGNYGYGVDSNLKWAYKDNWNFNQCPSLWQPAEEDEVEALLIIQAQLRGLKLGNSFIPIVGNQPCTITGYYFNIYTNTLFSANKGEGGEILFQDGKWATPIEAKDDTLEKKLEELKILVDDISKLL